MSIEPAKAAGEADPTPVLLGPKEAYIQQLTERISHLAQQEVQVRSRIQAIGVVVPAHVNPGGPSLDQLKGQLRNCRTDLRRMAEELDRILEEADRVETTEFAPGIFPSEIWNEILKHVDDPKTFKALMESSKGLFEKVWARLPVEIARKAVEADPTAYMQLVTYNNPAHRDPVVVLSVLLKVRDLDIFPLEYLSDPNAPLVNMIVNVRPELFFALPVSVQKDANLARVAYASASLQIDDSSVLVRFRVECSSLLTREDLDIMAELHRPLGDRELYAYLGKDYVVIKSPLEVLHSQEYARRYELTVVRYFAIATAKNGGLYRLVQSRNPILEMIRVRLGLHYG